MLQINIFLWRKIHFELWGAKYVWILKKKSSEKWKFSRAKRAFFTSLQTGTVHMSSSRFKVAVLGNENVFFSNFLQFGWGKCIWDINFWRHNSSHHRRWKILGFSGREAPENPKIFAREARENEEKTNIFSYILGWNSTFLSLGNTLEHVGSWCWS